MSSLEYRFEPCSVMVGTIETEDSDKLGRLVIEILRAWGWRREFSELNSVVFRDGGALRAVRWGFGQ